MDVAALSMKIDSSEVVKATADLDKFAASSDRAAAAGGKLSSGGNTAKLATDYARAARAADQAGGAVAKASQMVSAANAHVVTYRNHLQGIVAASGQAAAAQTTLATAVTRTGMATQQADAHVIAHRANLEKLATVNKAAAASGGTAATGIAAVGVAGKATGAVVSGLAGILGGFVGVIIGAVLSALIEFVSGLFEADKAMKTVELATDSLGEAQSVLGNLFDLATGKIKSQNEVLILNARLKALNLRSEALTQKANYEDTVGGFRGGTSGVGFGTKALGFLGFDVSGSYGREQGVASITQGLKDGTLKREEALRRTENLDFSGLSVTKQELQQAIIDGASAEMKTKYANLIDKSLDTGVLAGEFREPGRAARAARGRTGGGGKSDAEKMADLVRNAQAEITAEQNRSKAVELSAEAAAELEQKTKLLNAAASAGLATTPKLTAEIEKLSAAYAEAKVAADVAEVTKSTTDEIQKRIDAIDDEAKLIGLRGDALARETRELEAQKKFRDALPKEAIVVQTNLTGKESDRIDADNRARRIAKLRQDGEDAAYAMQLERGALTLSGEALIAYNYAMEEKIRLQRANGTVAAEEIVNIDAAAAAYARQRYEVDKLAEALALQREVVGGFFRDFFDGVRNGTNAIKAFGDAAVNALNRIIDKMLDKAIDKFLNMGNSGGGGGFFSKLLDFGTNAAMAYAGGGANTSNSGSAIKAGFKNANGNAFNSAIMRFANGGAFTNQIVSSPTLFRFASGAALGEMGEAGPEAIMPLSRGPNGKLGVQAHGGRSTRTTVRMGDVHNTYQFDGAVGIESIVGLIRQGGESTKSQIRRELQSMLDQLERDGTLQ